MKVLELVRRIKALNNVEQDLIEIILTRIENGRRVYGPWKIKDGRSYNEEALQEIIDALHYCAVGLLEIRDDD
jgi:hypothetical protein